ncbi:MAG: GTPase/DUF3482 domain-containing protein [Oleibacter sp.]|nr:GTPase/DUF3482 domain-containing protein [Thalassolituus sp.]
MKTSAPDLPVLLTIVGHTNTGKTSLVRTLLRNSSFGEVDNRAGTTRHVEAAQILFNGTPFIELRDTPGLEDSVALIDRLNILSKQQTTGRDTLQAFVKDKGNLQDFDQETKVIQQLLISDVLLYVIDCRESVLEKYVFELQCLSMAARPVIPVLNFIENDSQHKNEWRKTLADFNFHAIVEFDTVAFNFAAEKRLYRKFQTVLEPYYSEFEAFIDQRDGEWQTLKQACIQSSCEFLLKVCQLQTLVKDSSVTASAMNDLQQRVRNYEKDHLQAILKLLQFTADDIDYVNIPIKDGRWTLDLFAPEALKKFGVDTASAAATGAAIGAGLDLMMAGMSLGAATATGAILGSSWSAGKRFGKQILAKYRGHVTIGLDTQTINLLVARQVFLLDALLHRGHAAQAKLLMNAETDKQPHKRTDKASKLDYTIPLKVLKKVQNLAIPAGDEAFETEIKQVLIDWFQDTLTD